MRVGDFGDTQSRAYFNTDHGKTLDFLVSHGYDQTQVPEEQLFDLFFDTNEMCNLIHDRRYLGVAEELRTRLDRWQNEKKDPLLKGEIRQYEIEESCRPSVPCSCEQGLNIQKPH